MDEFLSSWTFLIIMGVVQVLMILSPLVVIGVVLVMLRRRRKGKDETDAASLPNQTSQVEDS